jgi:hypothetical protein
MIDNIKQVATAWRANVKEGKLYTFSMKSPLMHVYVTYSDGSNRLLLSVEKPIYNNTGQTVAIAILHLTDKDLDGLPDSALYACHFLSQGRLVGATNIPSEAPTAKDLEAWHGWLRVMIDEIQDHVDNTDQFDPDRG